MSSKEPFYGTQKWKGIRSAVFARDNYRCEKCGARGPQRGGSARLTADHAGLPLATWCARTGRAPEFYPLNWIVTLCDKCHGRKDGRRGRE